MAQVLKIGILDYQTSPDVNSDMNDVSQQGDTPNASSDPDIWFASLTSAARTLAGDNLSVLNTIRQYRPESIEKLAKLMGRNARAVLQMLQNMEIKGLVELHREKDKGIRPEVTYQSMQMVIDLDGLSKYKRARQIL